MIMTNVCPRGGCSVSAECGLSVEGFLEHVKNHKRDAGGNRDDGTEGLKGLRKRGPRETPPHPHGRTAGSWELSA